MSEAFECCPSCGEDLAQARQAMGKKGLTFCLSCKFPLVLVAGKYRLEQVLGEGGFGVIYLARHIRLRRDAERVVKILKPELFSIKGMKERFEREVQLTSILSQQDDHIVRIYDDFGEIPRLGHFYVMEYLQGIPLGAFLTDREKPPPLDFCTHVFRQLCDAMHFAHESEVIHRDLKPDNLFLIRRKEEKRFLKVLDFGIAKPVNPEEMEKTQLTQGALGTPYYLSPEQSMNQSVDARSDLYTMGIILYELLTGYTPFQPRDKREKPVSLLEILSAHIQREPPSPHLLRPDRVSRPLEELLLRVLAKKAEDRFASAREMKERFEEVMSSAPQRQLAQQEEERAALAFEETGALGPPQPSAADSVRPAGSIRPAAPDKGSPLSSSQAASPASSSVARASSSPKEGPSSAAGAPSLPTPVKHTAGYAEAVSLPVTRTVPPQQPPSPPHPEGLFPLRRPPLAQIIQKSSLLQRQRAPEQRLPTSP